MSDLNHTQPDQMDQAQPTAGTGSAVAGLVCSIASIALLEVPLLGLIFAIMGIVLARSTFGTLSKYQIRNDTIRWIALAALITGIVGTIIGVIYIIVIVVGAISTPQ